MEIISCHNNQSSYLIGIKKNNTSRSPCLYMLYVKYGENRLHGFRGNIVWKCWRTTDDDDGRTTDAGYTISSSMSLRLLIRFTRRAFRKLLSIYVIRYFSFDFEGRIWDLIVFVPDHCLYFYFLLWIVNIYAIRSAWSSSNSSMHQHSKLINQDSTLRWNKMGTQQIDQHWNAVGTPDLCIGQRKNGVNLRLLFSQKKNSTWLTYNIFVSSQWFYLDRYDFCVIRNSESPFSFVLSKTYIFKLQIICVFLLTVLRRWFCSSSIFVRFCGNWPQNHFCILWFGNNVCVTFLLSSIMIIVLAEVLCVNVL